jgi:hypothetical protein
MLGKFGAVTLGYACLLATAAAATPRQEEWIKVFISPECKEWIYGPPITQEDAQKKPKTALITSSGIRRWPSPWLIGTLAPQFLFTLSQMADISPRSIPGHFAVGPQSLRGCEALVEMGGRVSHL